MKNGTKSLRRSGRGSKLGRNKGGGGDRWTTTWGPKPEEWQSEMKDEGEQKMSRVDQQKAGRSNETTRMNGTSFIQSLELHTMLNKLVASDKSGFV